MYCRGHRGVLVPLWGAPLLSVRGRALGAIDVERGRELGAMEFERGREFGAIEVERGRLLAGVDGRATGVPGVVLGRGAAFGRDAFNRCRVLIGNFVLESPTQHCSTTARMETTYRQVEHTGTGEQNTAVCEQRDSTQEIETY